MLIESITKTDGHWGIRKQVGIGAAAQRQLISTGCTEVWSWCRGQRKGCTVGGEGGWEDKEVGADYAAKRGDCSSISCLRGVHTLVFDAVVVSEHVSAVWLSRE